MEKDLFIRILQHYSDSSAAEAEEVLSLKSDFPYSQLLHALSARLTKDHGFSNQQSELQMAAIYAADRAVLKDIMTLDAVALGSFTPVQAVETVISSTSTATIRSKDASEDVAEEVIHDLERLHELKHNFEMLFVDAPNTELKSPAKPVEKKVIEPEVAPEPAEPEHPRDTTKSKKARIIELAKAMQAQSEPETAPEPDPDPAKHKPRKKKKEDSPEALIQEIASTKEEIVPESERQKEQLEIIEQFIKTQPSITPAREKLQAASISNDLSTIKTGEFGENVVSETLVEILIKQGKKDKAIEVLKKLIWKFPQKKAYFAAQIEDLKK